ncbi:hypothetical protein XFF6166_10263 [Xanthomonas citri pv. fuscans]|nr:hypothetical protein XFF6166_10263 [Xanthomonas citri pv. fuscans]SOO02128.1 hypothetical protein XFF6960_580045 [Xanthomonas citri pv. fuscans]SOO06855.1 hypothetical protein XFF7767_80265 [Xanthomonas citri pv. fuscans]SOO07774.1 hypothetical protein XFF6970_1020046 [Xanthomonas citri pv. fuscans]SOO16409.1 hypothetical protein XFF7766_770263 [Xanthomonas citri pv. fuscans]
MLCTLRCDALAAARRALAANPPGSALWRADIASRALGPGASLGKAHGLSRRATGRFVRTSTYVTRSSRVLHAGRCNVRAWGRRQGSCLTIPFPIPAIARAVRRRPISSVTICSPVSDTVPRT